MHDSPLTDAAQAASEALLQFLYQAPIGVLRMKLDGTVEMVNPMSAQLLMPLAPTGDLSNLFVLLEGATPDLRSRAAAASYPGGMVCEDLRIPVPPAPARRSTRGAGGSGVTMLALRMVRLDADQLVASISDISAAVLQEQERIAAQVHDASRIDPLTALPNRTVVLERIDQALARIGRDPADPFAVLYVNADRFNRVNVSLGPAAGDELLRLMAARLVGAVRQVDAVGVVEEDRQTAARLGVDEFVLILENVNEIGKAAAVASRLVQTLGRPYALGHHTVHSSASVGVVLVTGATAAADAVLQDASMAMREAKQRGGGRYCLFEPGMKVRAQCRATLEVDLRQALQDGHLFVVYQPIVDLVDDSVTGVEALVRWRHPQRGVVPPAEFISIAEESGLITPLGRFVLSQACQQFVRWQLELGTQAPRVLSVNLSRAQLSESCLLDDVRHALTSSGLAASCLQLEITESLAGENPDIQARLHQLKRIGVLLALDDFGTGYSSLASLHQWPVDVIKIDRSFVSQIDTSAHHRVLVDATVRVARSLGMGTVAEGVETAGQAQMLATLECDKAQGYHYARPLDGEAATQWLQARRPAATERVAAQRMPPTEVVARLLTGLDATDVGVALFDPQERLAFANSSFRRTHCTGLGTAPAWEEIMRNAHSRRDGLLIENPDIEAWLASTRQRYRREPRRVFESDFADGSWRRVVEETAADGWQLCMTSDVTSLKVNEAALRQAHDTALTASITDALTGLPNRRQAFASLQGLLSEATALRTPLIVAVIDLDLFKRINDGYGHAAGDSVLVGFAHRLSGMLRPRDMLGRLGGEEFLLVLANTTRSGAEGVLAKARLALNAQPLVAQYPQLQLGFSAGLAMARPDDTLDSLWQRADRGLLEAKAAGRGRDVFVDGLEETPILRSHVPAACGASRGPGFAIGHGGRRPESTTGDPQHAGVSEPL
jgi:diguanylate cyclase (GGDEF)-like protein